MPTLELIKTAGNEPTGETMTLEKDGKLTFKGDLVKGIVSRFLDNKKFSNKTIFDNFTNWSNGYLSLRPKKE